MAEYTEDGRTDEELVRQVKLHVDAINVMLSELSVRGVQAEVDSHGVCSRQVAPGVQVREIKLNIFFSKVFG